MRTLLMVPSLRTGQKIWVAIKPEAAIKKVNQRPPSDFPGPVRWSMTFLKVLINEDIAQLFGYGASGPGDSRGVHWGRGPRRLTF